MSQEQAIREIFADVLGVPLDQVTDSLAYESITEWDSISHMDLIAVLEQTYHVTFSIEEITEFRSVSDARRILDRHGVLSTGVA